MRQRKLRGHRRRWKSIELWKRSMELLDIGELHKVGCRTYAKLTIHPWYTIYLRDSQYPQPTGKTRQLMLEGLLDIHDAWKEKLDGLNERYYLRIWLFEPHFTRSQVVCAIRDNLHFYDNTLYRPVADKPFRPGSYGRLAGRLETFQWTYALDEIHLDDTEPGHPDDFISDAEYRKHEKWVKRMLARPHRTTKFNAPIGEATESYSIPNGTVWIGGK